MMKVDLVSIIVVFISSIQSVRAQNVDLSLGLDALPPCAVCQHYLTPIPKRIRDHGDD